MTSENQEVMDRLTGRDILKEKGLKIIKDLESIGIMTGSEEKLLEMLEDDRMKESIKEETK